jgi:hypothetical protein
MIVVADTTSVNYLVIIGHIESDLSKLDFSVGQFDQRMKHSLALRDWERLSNGGHGFSRAVNRPNKIWASAPALFSMLLFVATKNARALLRMLMAFSFSSTGLFQ